MPHSFTVSVRERGHFTNPAVKLALFTDGTSQSILRRTGIAALCYDVTEPILPVLVFQSTREIPFCDAGTAEHEAALLGVNEVLSRVQSGSLHPAHLVLFTDADSVARKLSETANNRRAHVSMIKTIDQLRETGCKAMIETISREFNRHADALAHVALGQTKVATPVKGMKIIDQYPFLKTLNA